MYTGLLWVKGINLLKFRLGNSVMMIFELPILKKKPAFSQYIIRLKPGSGKMYLGE